MIILLFLKVEYNVNEWTNMAKTLESTIDITRMPQILKTASARFSLFSIGSGWRTKSPPSFPADLTVLKCGAVSLGFDVLCDCDVDET